MVNPEVIDIWPRQLFLHFLLNKIAYNLKTTGQILMQF